jgi:hypothetical protein
MSEYQNLDSTEPLAAAWDASLQQQVTELNGRLLARLVALAVRGGATQWPILAQLRSEWRQLSPPALQRLACCPYLLLDAGFAAPARWRAVLADRVQDAGAPPGQRDWLVSGELARRSLLLAWHLARSNPLAACIALGMHADCTGLIAAGSLQQLELIANHRPGWVRARWDQRVDIWRQLLQAASGEPTGRLRQLQLRGLQLMAASLMTRPEP